MVQKHRRPEPRARGVPGRTSKDKTRATASKFIPKFHFITLDIAAKPDIAAPEIWR